MRRARWARAATAAGTILVGAAELWASGHDDSVQPELPPRFYVARIVQPTFTRLRTASSVFRRQVDRLVESEVGVVVDVALPWQLATGTRAQSSIVRESGRVRYVRVLLGSESRRWVNQLPHELEHVVEQIEGVALEALARERKGAAWETGPGRFESQRATSIGEQVEREVRHYRGDPVASRSATSARSP